MRNRIRTLVLLWICAGVVPAAWAQPARYLLDSSSSTVTFHGHTPLHDFEGVTHDLSGSVQADLIAKSWAGAEAVRIPVIPFVTGNVTRDHAVHHVLEADKTPEIRFVPLTVQAVPSEGAQDGLYDLKGNLTIGHTEREVTLRAKVHFEDEAFRVKGEIPLKISDFDLKIPGLSRLMGLSDEVLVSIDTRWIKRDEV